jgi:hypothetical protein
MNTAGNTVSEIDPTRRPGPRYCKLERHLHAADPPYAKWIGVDRAAGVTGYNRYGRSRSTSRR